MNTSVETIENLADIVRTSADRVAERCGLKQGCGIDAQGSFLFVNFAFRPPIRIPAEWVMDHPMNVSRWVEELVEGRLRR
jgi:hypothetical protein